MYLTRTCTRRGKVNLFQRYLADEFVEDYQDGRLSRRQALKLIGSVTGSLALAQSLLAACAPPPETEAAPTQAPAAAPSGGQWPLPRSATHLQKGPNKLDGDQSQREKRRCPKVSPLPPTGTSLSILHSTPNSLSYPTILRVCLLSLWSDDIGHNFRKAR